MIRPNPGSTDPEQELLALLLPLLPEADAVRVAEALCEDFTSERAVQDRIDEAVSDAVAEEELRSRDEVEDAYREGELQERDRVREILRYSPDPLAELEERYL